MVVIIKYPKKISKKTNETLDKLYYEFFPKSDPETKTYLDLDFKKANKLVSKFPMSVGVAYDDNKIIGWSEIYPTTKEIMHSFAYKKISETQLYNKSINLPIKKINAIYFGLYADEKKYRHRHIITRTVIAQTKYYLDINKDIEFCVWPYSKQGLNLAQIIAKHFKKELYVRED